MEDSPFRDIVGRNAAFEALVWAIVRLHPNPEALIAAFKENAEIQKSHLVYLPLSEDYLDAFEKARKQILSRMA
jgi:hypothetical protein